MTLDAFGAPSKRAPKNLSRHQKITESLRQGHNIVRLSIPSYHIADDVIVYEVDVSNKKLRWNLWLRFEFFYVLHTMLQELVSELSTTENRILLPPFPEKRLKLFTDHFNEHFVENRKMLLNNYLRQILQNRYLRHSEIFISFLTPPENESLDVDAKHANHANNANKNNNNNGNDNDNDNSNGNKKSGTRKLALDVQKESEETEKESESGHNARTFLQHCMHMHVEYIGIDEEDEITNVLIPQAQILKHDHTVFQIHVFNVNKRKSFSEWTVLKRFGEFHDFDCKIRKIITNDYPNELNKLPPLPPKYLKLLVNHLDSNFIEKRRLLLQCYLQRLIKFRLLRRNELVLGFLGIYSQ